MLRWIKTLDQILRGHATQLDVLREDKIKIPIFGMAVVVDMHGIIYGVCKGLFSVTPEGNGQPMDASPLARHLRICGNTDGLGSPAIYR